MTTAIAVPCGRELVAPTPLGRETLPQAIVDNVVCLLLGVNIALALAGQIGRQRRTAVTATLIVLIGATETLERTLAAVQSITPRPQQ